MNKILLSISSLLISAILPIHAVQAADYTNSIGMEFKTIPAGTFFMGNCRIDKRAQIENQKENEKRRFMGLPPIPLKKKPCPSGKKKEDLHEHFGVLEREETIANDFQIGVYEVTLGQFKQFITEAGRDDLLTDRFMAANNHGDDAPATNVSWNDAQDFIKWLNNKEDGDYYRLPSEAEWEYAARAGTTTKFWWGDEVGKNNANCNGCNSKWNRQVAPVGSFKPNPFGLYDTSGNVWEWTQECFYNRNPAAPAGASPRPNDNKQNCTHLVLRGGSWFTLRFSLRSAYRTMSRPGDRNNSIGFRLARTL